MSPKEILSKDDQEQTVNKSEMPESETIPLKSFDHRKYDWWLLCSLTYVHLAGFYGLWLVPSAQWRTLLLGEY